MVTPSDKGQAYQGPVIFSYGFRLFFFFGALWAALAVPIWIAGYFLGDMGLPIKTGVSWHAHEMIFGYSSAIIAGFLLTAVPNWTGRLPIVGWPLFWLFALWLAGRLALLIDINPDWISRLLDSAFLIVFAALVFREVIAGKNKRNVKVALILSLLALANIGFHLSENFGWWSFDQLSKMGLGIVLMLIVIIGGRVTPAFTTNWLRSRSDAKPVPFNKYDIITLAVSGLSIFSWVTFPGHLISGGILLLAGGLNALRLVRWKFWAAVSEPLVLILHIAYGWAALAFALNGAAILKPDIFPAISGIHAIGTGAIGVMTLAIMTRATLGHSGRQLTADIPTVLIFILINFAAAARVATPYVNVDLQPSFTIGAALLWSLSFATYCLFYGRYLWRPKP
ncbi:NnrS family protein [Robiginitomaculum antarcticum]|uniref:NnrS family protein n=1 Tax=Robiginitomaculum antarcticum TaxID=437507 RepID=UPI00036F7686|nr:NnrS family protein [Robiginitomaculum antarcticum]